ncbi:hypothetical protein [Desertimonas flava]|jgi:hypothetical protein|nr:hypothetical protein [Desertimonas flava]
MNDINQVGKRYLCAQCGLTVMCAKGGSGRITCHGEPMELQTTKPLPSSD